MPFVLVLEGDQGTSWATNNADTFPDLCDQAMKQDKRENQRVREKNCKTIKSPNFYHCTKSEAPQLVSVL